jgi:hypothetical protein
VQKRRRDNGLVKSLLTQKLSDGEWMLDGRIAVARMPVVRGACHLEGTHKQR